jgi:hypothetical protein
MRGATVAAAQAAGNDRCAADHPAYEEPFSDKKNYSRRAIHEPLNERRTIQHNLLTPLLPEQTATDLTGNSATGVAPFVVEHRQEERALSGTFRPSARLILTERVRTSGLWNALTPEDFQTLLLLLTFLTPNGWCRPTLPELAQAMQVSHAKARGRLHRLTQVRWQGQPLAAMLSRPDGLDAYLPGRHLLAHENAPLDEPPQPVPVRTAGRDAVIAYSRARYTKGREEVEREIAQRMGWAPPDFAGEDPAVTAGKQRAYQAMTNAGMPKEQALDLLARFDLGAVESQIAWLPSRSAKNPARFLAAAIEGNYDRPLNLRGQADVVEANAKSSAAESTQATLGKDAPMDSALVDNAAAL